MEDKQDSKTLRRILTMAERVGVIDVYKEMTNKSKYVDDLSSLFNCGRSQIRSIIKDREDIMKEWDDSCKNNPYRVRRKTPPEVIALGKILSEWVIKCLRHKNKLNTSLIRHAATKITKILDFPKFRPTNRWLDRFLKKYRFIDIEHSEIFDSIVFEALDVKIEDIIVEIQNQLPSEVEEQIEKLVKMNISNRYRSNYGINKPQTDITNKKRKIDDLDDVIHVENENEIIEVDNNTTLNNIQIDLDDIIEFDINTSNDDDEPTLNGGPFDGWDFEANANTYSDSDDIINVPAIDVDTIMKNTPECPIKTLDDAIKYLKPLEEYVLLTSNYRAINFVTCLENLFKSQNTVQNTEFQICK